MLDIHATTDSSFTRKRVRGMIIRYRLNQLLIFKKVHRFIKLNEKVWLKSNIDMNTELRKNAKEKL